MTTPNARPAGRRRPAPTFHRTTVAEVSQLTPRMRRITLTGDDLANYPNDGPGTHFKLVLPAPEQSDVVLPVPGPDGLQWPDGLRPTMRTYTPRHIDTAARRMVVDFALHAPAGPATSWAASAAPGDSVVVTGGRGAYRIDPAAGFTVLAADETALPAVATILDDAPDGARVLVFAEVADAAEELRFDTAADVSTTWLYRGETEAGAGQLAAEAVRTARLPAGTGKFWIGLEAGAMRTVRRHLIGERGVPRDAVYTRAYWKYGAADHPDHDTGEDD